MMSTKKIDRRLLEPEKKQYKPSTEAEEWAKHGCANNEEWHEHLKRLVEEEFTPDLADDDM